MFKLVDAAPVRPVPISPSIPGYDPVKQVVCDRQMFEGMRERLHDALLKLERREQDVARLEARDSYLEDELNRLEQHHTNALKEVITLRQKARP